MQMTMVTSLTSSSLLITTCYFVFARMVSLKFDNNLKLNRLTNGSNWYPHSNIDSLDWNVLTVGIKK